jgi:hypothetical protein
MDDRDDPRSRLHVALGTIDLSTQRVGVPGAPGFGPVLQPPLLVLAHQWLETLSVRRAGEGIQEII